MEFIALGVAILCLIIFILHILWHSKDGSDDSVMVKLGTPAYEFSLAMEAHGKAQSDTEMDNTFFNAASLYDDLEPSEKRKLSFETRAYMVAYSLSIINRDDSAISFIPDFETTDDNEEDIKI